MNLSDDAPLLNLIDKPLEDMTNEELTLHVQKLQEASANVQAMKSKITKKKSKPKVSQRKQDIANAVKDLLK